MESATATVTASLTGPLPVTATSYPFSTARHTLAPIGLEAHGYLEEEYLLAGDARVWTDADGVAEPGDAHPYVTRVLVRRPADNPSGVAWLSILNASQGYDIEDDWRRAWDFIIGRRDTYVALTAKPINADALAWFDPERYAPLSWAIDGRRDHEPVAATPGWNPFAVLPGREEGLAWDMIAQLGGLLRDGEVLPAQELVFLIGQSQSAIYVNTYAHYFHSLLRRVDDGPLFDGYLPGVGSVLRRELTQTPGGWSPTQVLPTRLDLDVPVITVLSEGDLHLFASGGFDPTTPGLGDGAMSRQCQVARAPHSDPRSRVIPTNDEVAKARRVPRTMNQAFLDNLNVLPLEPVVTGAMASLVRWARDGVEAPASVMFTAVKPLTDESTAVTDDTRPPGTSGIALQASGGLRLGLVEHPLARFRGASAANPVFGSLELLPRDVVLARYASLDAYRAACDQIDDALEAAGYLEPVGRHLLHAIEAELWARVVDGSHALPVTPQAVPTHTGPRA